VENALTTSGSEAGSLTVIDPVCGMTVKLNAGKPSHEWKGETYHFCNPKCCHKFEADPVFYLTGKNKLKAKAAPKNTTFTCPMDPEIVQEGPGTCPICGMALEPMDGVSGRTQSRTYRFHPPALGVGAGCFHCSFSPWGRWWACRSAVAGRDS
jgi:YHS domain-containing protein